MADETHSVNESTHVDNSHQNQELGAPDLDTGGPPTPAGGPGPSAGALSAPFFGRNSTTPIPSSLNQNFLEKRRGRPPGSKTISKRRRQVFLQVYSQTGSRAHAASATGIALSRFDNLAARDPAFLEQLQAAGKVALGLMEAEVFRRSVVGVDEPQFQKGMCIGVIRKYSDHLLLKLLAHADPSWIDTRHNLLDARVEVTGQPGEGFARISASEVMSLPEHLRPGFLEALRHVQSERKKTRGPTNT